MRKISLFIVLIFCGNLFSQNLGSRGLLHTQSARTFEKGQLEVHTNANFYTKVSEYIGQDAQIGDSYSGVNYWLVASNLAITYGIIDNLDFTIAPRIYQDTHANNEYNLPGDIFLTLKAGSFGFLQRHMYGGILMNIRLATGEEHNYPFVEYASGAVEYGFKTAFSYFMDPYLPDRSLNMHLNLGWWNHNEAGQELTNSGYKAKTNSSELQYALGLSYPTAMFDFNLEANGISYLTEPDEVVKSRENWLYITPGVKYKPTSWFSIDLGIDIRVSSDENTTTGPNYEEYDLPNYAPWKVHLGLNLRILPLATSPRTAAEIERDEFQKRVDFFQKIVEDRAHSEDVQEELKQLIEEREEAEKELEELKRILEEEG
ncbi:MAG: hypothetical protein JW956_01895 [Calditrichaceae bacterium]|nr:hypothetical protein [Calditrichaceae bacterium]